MMKLSPGMPNIPKVALRGDAFVPARESSLHPGGGPVGVFDCGRGEFLVICALRHQWPRMVRALGMPDLEIDAPKVQDPQIGEFAVPGSPVRFSGWQAPPDRKAGLLGAHNEEILEELGLSSDEIASLYKQEVLVKDPASTSQGS
jgi:crotonobetainyl-CoA:carnitine CoA-transferase CaiB-like acyl-CoA transferase